MTLANRDFARILLIKLSAVGDVVHTIPVLNALRRRYPNAQIDWLIKSDIAALIRNHPAVNNVLLFDRGGNRDQQTSMPQALRRLVHELRNNQYDLVVDMHGQLRTALLTLITGAPVRIGWDRPRRQVWEQSARLLPRDTLKHAWKGAREGSWLAYTDHITIDTLDIHAVDRYLRVGALLGFDHRPPDFSFPIPQDADQRLSQLLESHGIPRGAAPVVISPTTQWETKHWIGTRFAEVARHLLAAGYPVALIGSGGERAQCRLIAEAAPGVVDLSGQTTLMELAALVRRSALCLTNDSGPMHLAVALDRPVVSIFGPTNPAWIGPYGRDGAVLQTNLPCAPCYLRKLRRCRYDHACMTTIETSAVIERIEKLLPHRPGDLSRVSLEALP